jgi:RHS repeat-associated protein
VTAIPCVASQPVTVNPGAKPGVPTVSAGTIPGTFSVTSSGEASYVLPLTTVPGRAGIEPHLAVTYNGDGDGVLGVGFSLSGLSSITRCPMNLAQDGEIRAVSYDANDPVCLDGKRLVVVSQGSGTIELRTFPDTNVKILAHVPSSTSQPAEATYFEAFNPNGLVVEYGHDPSGLPLASSGAAQAWLATKAHDGRLNTMTYAYCLAQGNGYTAEVAINSIQYTSFEGSPSLPPSRAVVFAYDTKDPADIRTLYAGGMALQSSLRLRSINMLGPSDDLARSYSFSYSLGPTTNRTRLTSMAECGADGVCKPATTFQYTTGGAGFRQTPTNLQAPTSKLASPMLLDVDGDGLDDFILPDTVPGLSTPGMPITNWNVAHNQGTAPGFFGASNVGLVEDWPMVANPSGPSDPTQIQPELGTAIDYDDDGLTDVLLHDVYDTSPNLTVLLAQPNHTFKQYDTSIPKPFPLAGPPTPPSLSTAHASIHLADVDGDGVPDLVVCNDHSESNTPGTNPGEPQWTVQLWKPASGGTPAGFEPTGADIGDQIDGYPCDGELYTVDVNGDGKVDLLIGTGNPEMLPGAPHYSALTRRANGTWLPFDTNLPIVPAGGKVVFLDLNGDGLPDAVESGQQDLMLATWINTGPTFTEIGHSLQGLVINIGAGGSATAMIVDQGTYLGLAVPIDYNGDGLQDLLVPVPGGTLPNNDVLPAWAILQSTGSGTFALVDPQIPFNQTLAATITPADPNAVRAGDLNGDGAQDIVLPINGFFNTLVSTAADLDLLATITDGMNAHDPTDPAFLPNVSITYGHLTDASITNSTPGGDPSLESDPYLAHANPANGCAYPRACAVGSHRVVTGYVTNNGADAPRRFAVRFRDGRFHRLGRGFLGFGERVVVDLDTQAGVATSYDNFTEQDLGAVPVFPYAGQVQHEALWFPGLSTQPNPSQFEATITDIKPSFVPTNNGASYMTLLSTRRVRKAEGTFPNAAATTAQTYVARIAAGTGATVLLDATTTASDPDPFGFTQTEDITAAGVDLTLHVERTYLNDTTHWILGKLQTQKECSAAAGLSKCRTLTRHTTQYGEINDDTLDSDEGIPDTHLTVTYVRDPFGNPKTTTAADASAFGHQRVSTVQYDSEGIYPQIITNAKNQPTTLTFDPNLGVLTKIVDPNNLPTTRKYDSLGRLGLEIRPDGSQTTITLARTKDGGPQQNAWRVTRETSTTGGADDTVELDSLGREIRWWWHGPDTGGVARVMQEIAYDALGEHVARRSVPISEGTPEAQLLNDTFQYDALGREVLHATPWGPTLPTSYSGLQVTATDAAGQPTFTVLDPLGRPVTVTDPTGAPTAYSYQPFGTLYTVTAPGNALTRTTRDAYGRVVQLDDPNRGTSTSVHDGFGELMSSTDALGRVITYQYDALGRTLSRLDQNGAEMLTTSWTWDTATNGVGKLATLTSPDSTKSYGYTPLSQLQTLTLDINGEPDPLVGSLKYDNLGRVQQITYPTPAGAAPFAIDQDRDAYGHVLTVRDDTTGTHYWHLTAADDAGRFKSEAFGNGVTTTRAYFPDKQRLQSITTTRGATAVQSLTYDYDDRLDLKSRADALQTQNTTERFRYDPVERLTCAYFNTVEDDSGPCGLSYAYDPIGNGNLTTKSDVGMLVYNDPEHPHAVTTAGTDTFAYDPVGNQTQRPGATLAYTPFDLPKTITQSTGPITFAYDGDENRIRKTTPTEETLYFGDLYQRDTLTGAPVAHRYYVRSPERVVAVVTVGGTTPGALYVHVDHLGSVDVLTDASGNAVEHRSYDPFGQRRNPVWGPQPPASLPNLTTVGYTGQEADNELGLVNMKGRIYDPKVGRFLTIDPLVADPLSAQSWNAYAYVENNPLNFIDPSGFEDGPPPYVLGTWVPWSSGVSACIGTGCAPPPKVDGPPPVKPVEGSREATQIGATRPSVDVSTNGSASGQVPQPAAAVAKDWKQNPWVQLFGGFASGVALGIVPFAGAGEQLLDHGHVISPGTPEARRGLAGGQIAGGMIAVVLGVSGEIGGGLFSLTGVGAIAGVPAMVVSAGVVTGGLANVAAGVRGLLTTGSGSGTPKGASGGERAGKRFTPKGRRELDAENADKNGGGNRCENCGDEVVPGQRNERGVTPPGNQRERDHIIPKSKGGDGSPQNGQILCRDCNNKKSDTTP